MITEEKNSILTAEEYLRYDRQIILSQIGEKGQIKVTYNGAGKFPGHFKKSITVRTNGVIEMTRLYVEGEMEEAKK